MRQYKSIILTLLVALFFGLNANAQGSERAVTTKIGDALNMLPADTQKKYNKLMGDIAETGAEGIKMLLGYLNKQDDTRRLAEYAINGYVSYVADPKFDAKKRQIVVDAIKAEYDKINKQLTGDNIKDSETKPLLVSNKEFLVRQLQFLGVIKAPVEAEEAPADAKTLAKNLKAASKLEPNFANNAARCVAISNYVEGVGIEAGQKTILKALKDDCRQYRLATIYAIDANAASEEAIKPIMDAATKKIAKAKDCVKVDLLYWMGNHPAIANTALITPLLSSANAEVVEAAAWTLARIGNPDNIADVAKLLASADADKVALAEKVLKSYKGNVCEPAVAVEGKTAQGETATLNLISARKASSFNKLVNEQLNASDNGVKDAAYKALKDVSTKDNLGSLYALLEKCDAKYVPAVQDAILAAMAGMSKDEQFKTINAKKATVAANKQNLYWPIVFKTANNQQLLAICNDLVAKKDNNLLSAAFEAYMKSISNNLTGAQRLLMYRNAMGFATNDGQKVRVLQAVAKTNTFLGIIYAGQFIEVPALQQAAAQAVRVLALGNIEFNGPEVVALLKRAAEVIKGGDAIYEVPAIKQHLEKLAKLNETGFVTMFNGKDLTGWKGLLAAPYDNPYQRAKLNKTKLAKLQKEANESMAKSWSAVDGTILFNGEGSSLCTEKQYGNFEMYVDWMLYDGKEPDAGIYLRGTPQVQIWDTRRTDVGAQVGSGGLYNNSVNANKPLKVADNPVGQWNSFYIKMTDERVTVYLNGELVVNNVIMENYWDRSLPIILKEQIELQAHGSKVAYRNLYIKELPQAEPYQLSAQEKKEGFKLLFDGTSLNEWQGDKTNYATENGTIAVRKRGSGFGNLYTKDEYGDFIFRFEFKLTAGANNGVGIRTPMGKDAAYHGMEIQILDHFNPIYTSWLKPYQHHGSVYGVIAPKVFDALKPVGEWNTEEIYAKGDYIRVTVNGIVITEGNIREASEGGTKTRDGLNHPGLLNKKGYIGFLGHGSELWLRNVRIKSLDKK